MDVTALSLALYVMPYSFPTRRTRCVFLLISSQSVLLGMRYSVSMLAGCGSVARGSSPPPELLYSLVKEVFSSYGPLLDSEKKQPLFNAQAWKDARNVLKVIQSGLLSDPPNIPLYYQIGVDKKHANLPLYRCVRGTNSVEGGVHHSGRRRLPISGVSARHASTRLHDFVLMHNLVVRNNILFHIYFTFNDSKFVRLALSIAVDLCTVAILMSG